MIRPDLVKLGTFLAERISENSIKAENLAHVSASRIENEIAAIKEGIDKAYSMNVKTSLALETQISLLRQSNEALCMKIESQSKTIEHLTGALGMIVARLDAQDQATRTQADIFLNCCRENDEKLQSVSLAIPEMLAHIHEGIEEKLNKVEERLAEKIDPIADEIRSELLDSQLGVSRDFDKMMDMIYEIDAKIDGSESIAKKIDSIELALQCLDERVNQAANNVRSDCLLLQTQTNRVKLNR